MAPLQREAPNPLYMQVKEALLDELLSGRYRPHDRLPSERELSQQFDVSRMTVRQALLDLARDGVIYARVGKGTFVAAPKFDQQLRTLTSFSQEVRSRGGQSASRVLEAREMAASVEVAAALQVAVGSPVWMLSRLRMADGVPMAIETTNLPLALCPGLLQHDFSVESLYQVLRSDYDIQPAQADQVIEAALAAAVEEGRITQEQADQWKAKQALRTYLDEQGFQTETRSLYETMVQQAVEAGVITQEQADAILSSGSLGGLRSFGGGHRGTRDSRSPSTDSATPSGISFPSGMFGSSL